MGKEEIGNEQKQLNYCVYSLVNGITLEHINILHDFKINYKQSISVKVKQLTSIVY